MKNRITVHVSLLGVFLLLFVGFLATTEAASGWGSVKAEKIGGQWRVTLENRVIKVVYDKGGGDVDCIATLMDKERGVNVAWELDSRFMPDNPGYGTLNNAEVVEDGDERKRVLLQFLGTSSRFQYVSIYEDRPYLEVEHVHAGHTPRIMLQTGLISMLCMAQRNGQNRGGGAQPIRVTHLSRSATIICGGMSRMIQLIIRVGLSMACTIVQPVMGTATYFPGYSAMGKGK